MIIRMLGSTFMTETGYRTGGAIYDDIPDDIAARWIKNGVAVEIPVVDAILVKPVKAEFEESAQANTLESEETSPEAQSDGQNEPELAVAPADADDADAETEETDEEPEEVSYADMSRDELELAAEALGIKVTKAMKTDTIIKKLGEANDND